MKNNVFSKNELLFLITISLALAIRQMAMTMVMPFISVYSKTLIYSNATLAGVALGIFGLMQAVFQIPFGILSDKIGNKRVILIGLLQVIVGLIIAFFSKSIYMLIFARALQGSGAILATGYSWLIGSVENKKRPKALSILGICVGFAAASSFALGPLINNYLTVRQMFLICAILILLVWIIILFFLKENHDKNPCTILEDEVNIKSGIKLLLKNKEFLNLNLAGFFNNYIMASVFYIVPIYLQTITGTSGMWKIFMPSVIVAIIIMKKSIIFVEKGYSSNLIILAFILSAIGICFYFKNQSFYFILIGSILFMTGYMLLGTVIPSMSNNIAENSYRGAANGIINSFQYIGSFVGSVITGALWSNHKNIELFLIISICIMGIFTVEKTKINFFKKNKFKIGG